MYKGYNLGNWLGTQKKKIQSETDDLYVKLSANVLVKASIDETLKKRETQKVNCLTFDAVEGAAI